jgi:small acid-soluble spore protein (thioredoxin-like protein)
MSIKGLSGHNKIHNQIIAKETQNMRGRNEERRSSKPDNMKGHKPDDRRNNVERIQYNIGKTIQNIELAEEMIAKTDDEKMKKTLEEKNKRRRESLNAMRQEIRDEAIDRRRGYDD